MLTKDLLVVRRYRGQIQPRYVDPHSPQNQELAQRVQQTFQNHLGKSREQLSQSLENLEDHKNFKLVRGLAQLLERKCLFQPVYTVEPKQLRRWFFQKGYVTEAKDRGSLIEEAARAFNADPADLLSSFWADSEEKQVLQGFWSPYAPPSAVPSSVQTPTLAAEVELDVSPADLLRQYNLSLTQTLLFDSLELWFQASGNYQEIFRWIKYLGLMYEAFEEHPGRVKVKVDGPASLFKETTRYGTSLAKLLPALIRAESWQLWARIKEGTKHYSFELEDAKRGLFPHKDMGGEAERFDSAVEEDFYRRIRRLMPDWQVRREPTILKAGPHIFIPDFGFERRGLRQYLEIVGFWTPDYLKKKLAKLKAIEVPLMIAVDRNLKCTEEDFPPGKEVFFFEKRLPLEPVIQRLSALGERQKQQELERLKGFVPVLEGDVIPLEELAEQYQVGVEALREVVQEGIQRGQIQGYHLLQGEVVSSRWLSQLKAKLDALPLREDGTREWAAVQDLLESYKVGQQALELVGYKVEWKSLLEARVIQIQRESASPIQS